MTQVQNALALLPLSEVERMAVAIAKSGLFGAKTPDQALALMLVAQSEGMHPATAAKDYHIIQGRPCLKADAMLARFQASGGAVKYHAYTDQKVEATFTHPQGGSVTLDWTIERAKSAGLTGKETWRQYPRQMLRARVLSEGIRTVFPAVCSGVYTPEEIEDIEPRNIPPPPAADPEPPKRQAKKAEPKPETKQTEKYEDAVIVDRDSEGKTTNTPEAKPTAADVAAKIKRCRQAFAEQGVKTIDDFKMAVLGILGRKVEGMTDLSSEELDVIIADLARTAGKEAA